MAQETTDGHSLVSSEEGAGEPQHPIGPGHPPKGFADPEIRAKAEATRKRRAAARRSSPGRAIRQDIQAAMPELGNQLVAAAKGEPPWDKLPIGERLKALFKALEYGVGRPEAMSKTDDPGRTPPDADQDHPAEEEPEQEGLTIA